MYICIDFDGTIVDHAFPEIGKPNPHAIYWMKEWQKAGAQLILFTMRSDAPERGHLTEAVAYLKSNGIELFGINTNPTQDIWTTSPKAYGHLYVDDAAFGCPTHQPSDFNRPAVNWQAIGEDIEHMIISSQESN